MTNIGKLAVIAVKGSVLLCDFLDTEILDDGKEPSWDGYIFVYEKTDTTSHSKKNMKGKVPVQIKGRNKNIDFSQEIIKFSEVNAIDIKNYMLDTGILYFVVFFKEGKKKIYYSDLTPYELQQIHEKGEKNIPLKAFPEDNDEKFDLLEKFCEQCRGDSESYKNGILYNLRIIYVIEEMQKKHGIKKKNYTDKNYEIYQKDEQTIVSKFPDKKVKRAVQALKGIPRVAFFGFLSSFFLTYWLQISENIIPTICGFFIIFILNKRCSTLFKNFFKKSTKFSHCLGYVLARWSNFFFVIGIIWSLNKANIISFDLTKVSLIQSFYATTFFLVIKIITQSLCDFGDGKFNKFCSDYKNELIRWTKNYLYKIKLKKDGYMEDDVKKLIDITIVKKSQSLDTALNEI